MLNVLNSIRHRHVYWIIGTSCEEIVKINEDGFFFCLETYLIIRTFELQQIYHLFFSVTIPGMNH